MKEIFNIYCDESCHLFNDHNKTFVLGAIWVTKNKTPSILKDLRDIKTRHNLPHTFEAKWTKISIAKVDYYEAVVRYFFENPDLHFRSLVVPDKNILDHSAFSQDHDTWYYKMFYILLNVIIKFDSQYHLYLDIKDTRSNLKVLELKRILNIASVEEITVSRAQQIRSHEVEIMQLVDILSGAMAYSQRSLSSNAGKNRVIKLIEAKIGKEIISSSARDEVKFNVLVWSPRKM